MLNKNSEDPQACTCPPTKSLRDGTGSLKARSTARAADRKVLLAYCKRRKSDYRRHSWLCLEFSFERLVREPFRVPRQLHDLQLAAGPVDKLGHAESLYPPH